MKEQPLAIMILVMIVPLLRNEWKLLRNERKQCRSLELLLSLFGHSRITRVFQAFLAKWLPNTALQ